mmetsp:Transcript_8488/g.28483  ORF Transcript_8488/g.28483 Transcript_8488/m.28483 type:complete len:761 (+) Transcript_8488:204-2486(+)
MPAMSVTRAALVIVVAVVVAIVMGGGDVSTIAEDARAFVAHVKSFERGGGDARRRSAPVTRMDAPPMMDSKDMSTTKTKTMMAGKRGSRALKAELAPDQSALVDYCALGAGPGGIQLATYLTRELHGSPSVVVLEKRDVAGSFFAKFPVHRKLISINKRAFTKKQSNLDFQMRHDWNSLIDPEDWPDRFTGDDNGPHTSRARLLMQNYSTEYYPHADDLARYLDDFATQKLDGHVSYDTEVLSIDKEYAAKAEVTTKTPGDGKIFVVKTSKGTWRCNNVISATGLHAPKQLPEHLQHPKIIGYEELSDDPSMFEGKRVGIFGAGNAAFEVASTISKVSAHCDVMATSEIRFAHQTHYPGALRLPNSAFLDQYLLKSLDSFYQYGRGDAPPSMTISEGFGGLVMHFSQDTEVQKIIASGVEEDCRSIDGCFYYDYLIRAVGWYFDTSVFGRSATPNLEKPGQVTRRGGKYPAMTSQYESENVPGLYFAGAVAHALDFGKSAGGFIHGFRYTSRALARHLNVQNHGGEWPMEIMGDIAQTFDVALKRINTASSLYQMYGALSDIILIDNVGKRNASGFADRSEDALRGARYFIDVPLKMVQDGHFGFNADDVSGRFSKCNAHIVTITLEFGENFHGRYVLDHATRDASGRILSDDEDREDLFLHPVLRLYRCVMKRKRMTLTPKALLYTSHLEEDLATDWTSPDEHQRVLFDFLGRAHDAAGGDVAAHDFDRDHRISANAHSHSAHQTYAKAAPHYATRMSN